MNEFRDDRGWSIKVFTSEPLDPINDNVDVEVRLSDGSRWFGTFFTLPSLGALLESYIASGECLGGQYVWAAGMVVVRSLSTESIRAIVADMIELGELHSALRPLGIADL